MNIYAHYNKKRLNMSENDLSSISMAVSDLYDSENDGFSGTFSGTPVFQAEIT